MTSKAALNPYTPPQAVVEDALEGMDSTFSLNLFSSQGRIGRVRYLAYSFGLSLLIAMGGGALAALIGVWLFVPVYAFLFYTQVMLTIKRCHDFDTSGWLSLLVFVPIVNLVFLFIRGTEGANRFGNQTAPNGRAAVVAVLLVVAIPLIGIAAAIAIPAYQSYAHRAQAGQAH